MTPDGHIHHEQRELPCAVCGMPVYAKSCSTSNPEAPELLHIGAAWFGIVKGDAGPEIVVVCARILARLGKGPCLDAFFAQDRSTT